MLLWTAVAKRPALLLVHQKNWNGTWLEADVNALRKRKQSRAQTKFVKHIGDEHKFARIELDDGRVGEHLRTLQSSDEASEASTADLNDNLESLDTLLVIPGCTQVVRLLIHSVRCVSVTASMSVPTNFFIQSWNVKPCISWTEPSSKSSSWSSRVFIWELGALGAPGCWGMELIEETNVIVSFSFVVNLERMASRFMVQGSKSSAASYMGEEQH
jgi:hypothetical protein